MVMPAIGCLTVVMLVHRNPAVVIMVMVFIDADLRCAMLRLVDCPCRNRNAHAKRQPHKGKEAQEMADGMIHLVLLNGGAHNINPLLDMSQANEPAVDFFPVEIDHESIDIFRRRSAIIHVEGMFIHI
jgi:hypothetical protein